MHYENHTTNYFGVVDTICGATYAFIGSTTPHNTEQASKINKINENPGKSKKSYENQ